MSIVIGSIQSVFSNVAPFFILLGILIFVHEGGHFLMARIFGVRVETFSLGFGKKILSFKRGDTTYCLSIIPLGGYVKMYGDDPNAQVPEAEKQFAFIHKPLYQRFLVVLAGPLTNLIFAMLIFSFIVGFGEEVAGPFVGDVAADTQAYKDGFRSGDKVLKINGDETPTWNQVQKKIEDAGGSSLSFQLERKGESAPLQFDVPVVSGENDNIFSSSRKIGQVPGLTQESRSTVVGVRDAHSPAALAGVQSLELLATVDGKKVAYWRELEGALHEAVKPESKFVTVQMRDLEKDKNDLRTVEIPLKEGWDASTNLTAWLGLEPAELYIYRVSKNSPAETAGMLSKDKLIRIGGQPIVAWSDVLNRVKTYSSTEAPLEFVVNRGGEEKSFTIKPEMTTLMSPKGQEEHRFTIGITSGFFPMGPDGVFYRLTNPIEIVKHGVTETWYWTEFVVMSMVRLIQGEVSAKNIGGVITIGRVASHSFAAGLSTFLRMMGLISINLFLLNLLPIPVLDGGHLLFYTIEGLSGSPLSMRKMEIAQQVGLMLLMFLMAFAFFNDITNLISTRM